MGYVYDNAGTQYYIRSYVIITIIVVIVHHSVSDSYITL